jgi:hypothetical protein
LFNARRWTFGFTDVGNAQYVDAFQRAMFDRQTRPGGINPGYHVRLALTTLPTRLVAVPDGAWSELNMGCGNGKLGMVDIHWWDVHVRRALLPAMASKGVTGKDLALFVFGNVALFAGSPSSCCVRGYHSATGSGATFQSYAVAMYDSSGVFGPKGDVATMTHEVAEWVADPSGTNPTKPWSYGQFAGCQSNLEVGDPLTGVVRAVAMNGFTYHVQELAFFSWFYHRPRSPSANGWYSNFGTFTAPAKPCP